MRIVPRQRAQASFAAPNSQLPLPNPARRALSPWKSGCRFAALALLAIPASAAAIYNFTSFDGPGNNGGGTTVNAIDNNGAVVGFSSDNPAAPTLLTNFIRNPDGAFTILQLAGDPLASANGINSSLFVVGGLSTGAAFLQAGGTVATLAIVLGTATSQTAFGIDDAGLIVGQFVDGATGNTPGYILQNGVYSILNPVANALVTNPQAVNNHGVVTGFFSTDGVHQHGFFYDSATGFFTFPPDPVVANLFLTQFLGINDNGLAVGYYQLNDGSLHGFLYDTANGTYSFLDDPNAAHSGVSVTGITGVNDSGEIAGFYVDGSTGLQRGFVATPAPSAVPEPGTFTLMGLALCLLAAVRFTASPHTASPRPRVSFKIWI